MHKPLSGPAPALAWAAISTMSQQSGSIWTRTASRRKHRYCPLGLYRKTGARVCAREPEKAMESQERRCKARGRRKETVAIRRRQLVGVMVATARAVTVQLKSLMAYL